MREFISLWQFMAVNIVFLLGASVLFSVEILYLGRDTWIAEILSLGLGFTIFAAIAYIVTRFPGQEIGEIFDNLFGKYWGRAIMLLIIAYAAINAGLHLFSIEGLMKTMVMQETPEWVFSASIALVTGFILRYGIEVFARSIEIMTPILISAIIILLLATVKYLDPAHLSPFFTASFTDVCRATLVAHSQTYSEGILMLFLAVLIKKSSKITKGILVSLLIAGILTVSRPLLTIGIFGAEEAADIIYPIYISIRQISIGDFIERIELLYLFVWFITSFARLAISIYCIAKGLQYLINLPDYKNLTLPIAIAIIPLASRAMDNYQQILLGITGFIPLINIQVCIIFFTIFLFAYLRKKAAKAS